MLSNIKYAARSLLKPPGVTVVVVLTLALGIGANTAIFSMVKSALLHPLPYSEPERLVFLWEKAANFDFASISWPDLQDWQKDTRAFTAIGGFRRESYRFVDDNGPKMVTGLQASAALFAVLKTSPLLGRVFTHQEDKAGAPGLVVLSHAFWQRRFNGDPAAIGRAMNLNGAMYTVIGVQRPELELQNPDIDIWTQLGRLGDRPGFQDRDNHQGILAVGRMKPGVTFTQAMADMKSISARIQKANPSLRRAPRMSAAGALLLEKAVEGFENLWLLQGAVGLVLLIACANVAGLLLARGAARDSELALRAALGASRSRLMSQLLLECLLLAIGGGALGLLVAHWAHGGIIALKPPGVAIFERTGLDQSALVIACVLAVVTALIFGLWPAWKFARPDLRTALQAGGRTNSSGGDAARARAILIVGQVALTVILLAGSGLLLKSFMRAQALDLGFNPHGVLSAGFELPQEIYDSEEKIRNFNERLLPRLRALPGADAAAIAAFTPLQTGWQAAYTVEGQPSSRDAQPFAEMNVVSDDYFRTLQIPLLRGRGFGPADTLNGERAVIIDQASAKRHWPDEDAIGKKIRLGDNTPLTVVGVVPTLHLYGYAGEPRFLQAYLSSRQSVVPWFSLLIRARRDPAALANAVRHAVLEIDPKQPVWDMSTFDDRVDSTFDTARLYTFLLAIFAGLALLLCAIGLYGLLAFQVTRRTREFGIRIALGALHRQVIAQVLTGGMKLLAGGLVIGLAGALLLGRILGALLYRTRPVDPAVLACVVIVLAAVALLACWLPARRATKVDPMIALRAE